MVEDIYGQIPSENQPEQAPSTPEVYTMPNQYMGAGKAPSSGGSNLKKPGKGSNGEKKGKTWIIFVVIGVLLLAVLGGAGYFLMQYLNQPEAEIIEENVNIAPVNTNINANDITNEANENSGLLLPDGNDNTNENANRNANSNGNSNLNFNGNVNTGDGMEIISSVDSDSDGLTDEEELLYGTKTNKPDSDGDGFLDGEEVKNGYNPNGKGEISANDQIDKYSNEAYGYVVLYPKGWIAEALNEEDSSEVLFTSETAEFVSLTPQDNPNGLSVEAWYRSQFPDKATTDTQIININGQEALVTANGTEVYFGNDYYIYGIKYNYGLKKEVNFLTTFKMMYQGFKQNLEALKNSVGNKNKTNTNTPASENANTNTNNEQNTNASKLPYY
ncbi:MAG: hypothetical protein ABH835_03040 [Patescibacteria group bacterium]|nr:hypothetical protein [Patescibacteria group bacterium]